MIEILKICANWGFPAVLCIYLLFNFGKKLDKLSNTISNDLVHSLERNTEVTKKDTETGEKIEKAIDNLSNKIMEFINRK